MDIDDTIAPKSDQLNAEDLIAGPRTYTIDHAVVTSGEQPVNIHLVELPGRPYRPSKTMRRVLVNAWGKKSAEYAGRRLTLYRDPAVKFGGEAVGGIKISHMSGLSGPVTVALTVTRGKRAPYTVEPLPDVRSEPTVDDVAGCSDVDQLRDMYRHCVTDERRDQIKARVDELQAVEP